MNVARCNCKTARSLRFQWSLIDGRRVLEPEPAHAAPDAACRCGLYSLRSPRQGWYQTSTSNATQQVVGAVASWGHIQVHAAGIRAEYACIVAIAYPNATSPDTLAALQRIAEHYRVELVPLIELEKTASNHGRPLPASLHEASTPAPNRQPTAPAVTDAVIDAAPDAFLPGLQPSISPRSASSKPKARPPLSTTAKTSGVYALAALLGVASLAIGLLSLLHPIVIPWAPALAHISELPPVAAGSLLIVPVILIGWAIWRAGWNLELDLEAWRQWRRRHASKLLAQRKNDA
jgi:hypothetical protein